MSKRILKETKTLANQVWQLCRWIIAIAKTRQFSVYAILRKCRVVFFSSLLFIFHQVFVLCDFRYMKYLYPYEGEKLGLSTPSELQAAIDGNRREGRRSSYGTYGGGGGDSMLQRNPHTPVSMAMHPQMSPLSLVSAVAGGQHHGSQSLVNGSAAHTPMPHHPHHPQHPSGPIGT